jgi:hypothetical protein
MIDFSKDVGKTLQKYLEIALALNSFSLHEKFTVNQLAEKAGVHHNTAKKALLFFISTMPHVPDFKLIKKGKRIAWVRK